jgi:hypothetical protein
MIDFACQCGQRFSMPEDRAGTEFQCPKCRRLVDVPTLSEITGIRPDGTYIMDSNDTDPAVAHQRFTDFVQAFGRETHTEDGFEKDLRLNDSQLENVGVPAVDGSGKARVAPPKYDPITGELLRPIELAPVPVQTVRPLPQVYQDAGRTLNYASQGSNTSIAKWSSVWLELFSAPNMMVMFFPFVCHLFMQLCFMIIGFLFPAGALFLAALALLAHYGAIPTSIGTDDKDELPRPLGSLNWHEDLWGPFCNLTASLLLCYAPAHFALRRLGLTPEGVFIGGSIFACGTLLFPAVLLTMTTGGTMLNLRPDRVLGVIRVAGLYYIVLVAEWVAAAAIYVTSILALHGVTYMVLFTPKFKVVWWVPVLIGLMIGIYLTHLFLWHLGLLYRAKGAQFPWVLQQHVRAIPDSSTTKRMVRKKRDYLGKA